ncbi:hypothetical protein CEXT_357061 [Caerostris extrusa]|uniref:Uncharacterized protein n=1 Tax=Caerostris extrusa TaxID=172846 RepID=A0AAV4WA91_CAEEX|nr:hypothetical protein CEXT_357061 [Caerostris extrusa]
MRMGCGSTHEKAPLDSGRHEIKRSSKPKRVTKNGTGYFNEHMMGEADNSNKAKTAILGKKNDGPFYGLWLLLRQTMLPLRVVILVHSLQLMKP